MTHMLNSQKAVSHARILFVILTSVILILTKKISGDAWTRVKRTRICDFRARVLLRRALLRLTWTRKKLLYPIFYDFQMIHI